MLSDYFQLWLCGGSLANLALVSLCALSIIAFAKPARLSKKINHLFSKIIHVNFRYHLLAFVILR